MSGIEKNWEEEATKWEDGINPTEVTKDELTDYVRCKMYVYTEIHDQLDWTLWESFQWDFGNFTVDIFTQIPSYWLQQLRDCLNSRGVWVNANHRRGKTLTQSLYDIAQEEDKTEWTREKMNALENKFGTSIKSRCIKYYKTHGTPEERQARHSSVPTPSAIPQSTTTPTVTPSITPQPIATRPLRTQIPTPVTPQPPVTSIPQQAAPTATQPTSTPTTPPFALPTTYPSTPVHVAPAPVQTPTPTPMIPQPPVIPIAAPPATLIATPTAPTTLTSVQTASLPLSRRAPVEPLLYHQSTRRTNEPTDEPTNQIKSSERQNKVFAKTPIGPCLTPQTLKTTTTTESKINLIQYTALNPCTSSSSNCSDETRVDISGSQQVESGNQDQATDQEELNPQDNDAIRPQASKDNPPHGLPTPAQSPEPQPNITTASTNREPRFEHIPEKEARPRQEIRGDIDNKLVTSCQGIPACRYAVTTINTTTDAFPTDTDPFTYNTTSHYTFIKFMGAMIDTRASKYSTAGHDQFLAFQRLDTGVQLDTTTQGIG